MKKKLSLNHLQVNSFVTQFDAERMQTMQLKGGTGNCASVQEEFCDDPNSENGCDTYNVGCNINATTPAVCQNTRQAGCNTVFTCPSVNIFQCEL